MTTHQRIPFLVRAAVVALALLAAAAPALLAHAILVEASPAAKATVGGPDVTIRLRFNSRIDAARSHLTLAAAATPDQPPRVLTIDAQKATPEVLAAKAVGLHAGAYTLRWQVLAADGHISRGEVPFQVK